MTAEEWADFDTAEINGAVNEIGCRNSQRLFVARVALAGADGQTMATDFLVNDWVEVQPSRYRYQAIDTGETVTIKMVLADYLACEVTWRRDDKQREAPQ